MRWSRSCRRTRRPRPACLAAWAAWATWICKSRSQAPAVRCQEATQEPPPVRRGFFFSQLPSPGAPERAIAPQGEDEKTQVEEAGQDEPVPDRQRPGRRDVDLAHGVEHSPLHGNHALVREGDNRVARRKAAGAGGCLTV